MSVLTNLGSSLFRPGEIIVDYDEQIKELIVISKGKCDLHGKVKLSDGSYESVLITRLRKWSWYGELQILMDLKSDLQLNASIPIKSPDKYEGYIHVFKLDAEKLKRIVKDYPSFKAFLLIRATQRRSYFKQVLYEISNIMELNRKRTVHDCFYIQNPSV